jgi:hypothetical protein
MSLLGPIPLGMWVWFAIGAAALAVSAYIIKMRRRRFEVPFSQLWQRVLEQKEANALWKQLKRLLSLLFILAILAIVLFAALDPTLGAVDRKARSVAILLDASASMKAMDGDDAGKQSRLDAAKQRAKRLVDAMGGGDVALVFKVDGQATPVSRFTSDGPMLDKKIDEIEASDTPADLPRALGAAADALRDRPNPLIVLVSDGAFPEQQLAQVSWEAGKHNLAAVDLAGIDVRYLPVGHRSDNVGIVAFNVRRYIANKATYEAYIEIQNFGPQPAHRQLTLFSGDTPVDRRKLDFAPGQRIRQVYEKLPGLEDSKLRAVLRPVEGPGGSDPFALDDTAYALLPPRKKQKVLMVTQDNLFLEAAALVYDNIESFKVKPAEYDAKPSIADGMDVVIFDDYTPAVIPPPPVNLLYFHPTGPGSPIAIHGDVASPHITEIAERHPVLRSVTLSDVYVDKSEVFAPDASKNEEALAYYVRDPVIAAKRDGHRKIVAFGYSLPAADRNSATDMPLKVAFPVMFVNILDWFAGDQADLLTTYPTGQRERVPLDGVVGANEADVHWVDSEKPNDADRAVTHTPVIDGLATFYGSRVGYYELEAKAPDGHVMAHVALAANLASPTESDIAPSASLTLAGKQLEAPKAFAITHSQKLWIYLVLLAFGLIAVEWVTYHRRITV